MKDLYCIRFISHGDVTEELIAAPTQLWAEDAADELNRLYQGDDFRAQAEPWPWGSESHARSLAKGWPEYAATAKDGRRRRQKGARNG